MAAPTDLSELDNLYELTPTEERVLGLLLGVGAKRGTVTYTKLGALLGWTHGLVTRPRSAGRNAPHVGEYSQSEWGILVNVLADTSTDGLPSGRRGENPSGFWGWVRPTAMTPPTRTSW